jgi:hypothetical protein
MKGDCEVHGPVDLVQVPGTQFDFYCPRCAAAGGTEKARQERKAEGRFGVVKQEDKECAPCPPM